MLRSLILLAAACVTAALGETLTLSAAVDRSLHNYPSLRVSEENVKAAAAGIQLARTAYLPKVEITVWVTDEQAAALRETVPKVARTGRIGDGKVFVVPVAWDEPLEF